MSPSQQQVVVVLLGASPSCLLPLGQGCVHGKGDGLHVGIRKTFVMNKWCFGTFWDINFFIEGILSLGWAGESSSSEPLINQTSRSLLLALCSQCEAQDREFPQSTHNLL